jgi:outer membrane lipoprotein-sorting protein
MTEGETSMSACLRVPACAVAALLLTTASTAAQTPTVEEIVAKNLAARGGVEKLRSLNSVKITGIVTAQGMELPMTSWAKRPNRIRRDTKFQDQKIVVAFDGTTVWGINPMMGSTMPQQITGPQADLTREEASFDPLFLTYKERGHAVEFVGTETLEGTSAHHLKVTKKNGNIEHHYLNAETGLEIRSVSTLEQGGMKAEITTELGDYQSVDGMQVAFSMKQSMNGNPMVEVKLQKVEFNVPIDEELFKMPK